MPVAPKPAVAQVAVSRNPYLANPYFANQAAVDAPESVNADAYVNWLFRIKPSNPSELDALLTADAYAATL